MVSLAGSEGVESMEQMLYILLGCMVTSLCVAFWYTLVFEDEYMPFVMKTLLSISILCLVLMSWLPMFIK